MKGSPDTFSQGEFNGLTLWEQLDNGIPWTRNKKVFFLVPTILCVGESEWIVGRGVWMMVDGMEPTRANAHYPPTLFPPPPPPNSILAASYVSNYDFKYLAINAPVYVILGILPKIPEMHRVRLFGINSTIGIDDADEPSAPPAAGPSASSGSKKKR